MLTVPSKGAAPVCGSYEGWHFFNLCWNGSCTHFNTPFQVGVIQNRSPANLHLHSCPAWIIAPTQHTHQGAKIRKMQYCTNFGQFLLLTSPSWFFSVLRCQANGGSLVLSLSLHTSFHFQQLEILTLFYQFGLFSAVSCSCGGNVSVSDALFVQSLCQLHVDCTVNSTVSIELGVHVSLACTI
mmetsp:Transcript_121601/g.211237  ORF Transcript_121601/g.211237 Transcript_121601/m.211237 type:complete len:183 (+) Transcript_121601:747-1295(+)